jgi:hypothetical protein
LFLHHSVSGAFQLHMGNPPEEWIQEVGIQILLSSH